MTVHGFCILELIEHKIKWYPKSQKLTHSNKKYAYDPTLVMTTQFSRSNIRAANKLFKNNGGSFLDAIYAGWHSGLMS